MRFEVLDATGIDSRAIRTLDRRDLPLAARRALDVAGLRLSLEGYQSLPYEDRVDLAALGAKDQVDTALVERLVRKSATPPTRIKPVADPDARMPPEQLNATLGAKRAVEPLVWSKLRAGRASVNQITWLSARPRRSSMRRRAAKDWWLWCMSSSSSR